MSALKRTPLFDEYAKSGGKTIDFGGWELPVQFSSIKEEHEAVRTNAGLFDVSHMGEIDVKGPGSLAYLQNLVTNDVSKLQDGQAQYTAMCYADGGTVDDLLVYRYNEQSYLLVVNASNIEKDYAWMKDNAFGDVEIINVSDNYGQLAVQGPNAEKVLQSFTEVNLADIKFFRFQTDVKIGNDSFLVSRTGYTGEDGFEVYGKPDAIVRLWRKLLDESPEGAILPCGLGARDTLRFEACLPLYGQELTKDISPLEAGVGFVVKTNKEVKFNGKSAFVQQKEKGLQRKLVGIELIDKGIPRHGYDVYAGETKIGVVTTGTQSPTLKKNIGLALLDIAYTDLGTEVEVEIRGKRLKAVTIATPFYKRSK